jgi:signal peptidase I
MAPRRRRGLVLALLGGVPLLASAAFLLLASVHSTRMVGASMEPRLHAGDLVVTRPHGSYRVGEVVLYRNGKDLGLVLHRIVEVRDGRYSFKGDSNQFGDGPGQPRSAIVGAEWLRIPNGAVVPFALGAFVAALALAALLCSGVVLALSRKPAAGVRQ